MSNQQKKGKGRISHPASSECLKIALKYLIEERRMTSSFVAEALGMSYQHVYGIQKGTRTARLDVLDQFASLFGMASDEFLKVGRDLLEGVAVFPYGKKVADLPKQSERRAQRIYLLVGQEFGLEGTYPFVDSVTPPRVDEYVAGKLNDAQFYQSVREVATQMVNSIKEANRKK